MSSYSRVNAVRGTTSIYTQSLRHVKASLPRFWNKRVVWSDPSPKDVKPKDRIKWWNIVPGDQVRIRGEDELREVQAVNKLRNMVYLRHQREDRTSENAANGQGVHYSRCQLYIGKHQFPPEAGNTEPRVLPVFATRVQMTRPGWNGGYYHWTRFAANTAPRLPGSTKDSDERLVIPWPKPSPKTKVDPTEYDTPAEAVSAITYVLPRLPPSLTGFVSKPPTQQAYINAIHEGKNVDPAGVMEVHLARELSNPHSRAKKQARWQAAQKHKRELLEQILRTEYKHLNGRTRKVAKQEAIFKWRVELEKERKAELYRRSVARGDVARLERQKIMKARKAARLERKLTGLELRPAANQSIPKSQQTTASI
ncbi:hypothetical protein BDY19DRAFT_884629 [Irpex rosettiformis]|uniref:Uncharacterized protein n=1 Tax=Irpex rosettiformis TaxID=378272 RepID=A0ACB8UC35_9APHY|nr:hypothetical protein BDY19DRAFT_884629 [Irpex rosettiformis]